MNPLMIAIYFGQIDVVRLFMEEFSIGVIQKGLYDSNDWVDSKFWLENQPTKDVFGLKLAIYDKESPEMFNLLWSENLMWKFEHTLEILKYILDHNP